MKRSALMIIGLGLMLTVCVPYATATTSQAEGQDAKQQEADAYKAWWEANQAKEIPKAMGLARAYLEKYPSGQYADYLKKWIVQARGYMFNQARSARNTSELVRIGKEALAEDPDNLDYLYLLAADIRANELFASPPNYSHSADASRFSRRAIDLIEAGKVPTIIDKAKWNQNSTLAWLYQNLALIDAKNGNQDKAIEYYKKSSDLDPSDASLNAFNYLACGSLYQTKYQAAVQKFQAFPEEDRAEPDNKPEVKAALDEANRQADMVIECWARFMASPKSTDYGATRAQVEKALADLYKYRHPDSEGGLQKLIEQYRSGNSATASGSASAKP
jgi:tetratricopeptide (TPR) repeat protein